MGEGLEDIDDRVGAHGVFGLGHLHHGRGAVGELDEAQRIDADLRLRARSHDRGVWRFGRKRRRLVLAIVGAVDRVDRIVAGLGRLFGRITLGSSRGLLRAASAEAGRRIDGEIGSGVGGGERWLHELDERHEAGQVLEAAEHDKEALGREARARVGVVLFVARDGLAVVRVDGCVVESGAHALGIYPERERRGDDGRHHGHEHEHGEDARVEDARREADVEHNELDEALARHERADSGRLAQIESKGLGGRGTSDELGEEGDDDDGHGIHPCLARVEVAEVGLEARECKVDGQEDDEHEILHLFGESDGVAALVGHHEADKERAKDGVYADDVGDPCADENEKEGDHDHDLVGAVLEAAGAACEPDERGLDEEEEHEDPANGAKQNVERGETRVCVDEGDGESEEDPADDVVAYTGSKHNDTDLGVQKLCLGEDAGEHRERDADRDGSAHAEGEDHACDADCGGLLGASADDAHVDLEADEEEEEDETEGGDEVEVGERRRWEDVLCEAGDATHGGGAEEDAADDLCDDTRLAQSLEREAEYACDDDDDGGLDDEQTQRVGRLKGGGVGTAEDAVALGGARHQESRHDCMLSYVLRVRREGSEKLCRMSRTTSGAWEQVRATGGAEGSRVREMRRSFISKQVVCHDRGVPASRRPESCAAVVPLCCVLLRAASVERGAGAGSSDDAGVVEMSKERCAVLRCAKTRASGRVEPKRKNLEPTSPHRAAWTRCRSEPGSERAVAAWRRGNVRTCMRACTPARPIQARTCSRNALRPLRLYSAQQDERAESVLQPLLSRLLRDLQGRSG
ncbi:hypothetical protein L1887_62096 [Cichorium endivia]|nr:hypothetical protein L1887_62096 [Cichorium endivia]